MIRAVIACAAGAILLSCSAVRIGKVTHEPDFASARLGTAASAADSAYLREMNEVMRIIDIKYWRDSLKRTDNLADFRAGVEKYFAMRDFVTRPDTPDRNEWREEIEKRIAFGKVHLLSTLYAPLRDIRWEFLLKLGIPSFMWKVPDTAVIDIYQVTWDNAGVTLSFGSMKGGGAPVRVVSRNEFAGVDPLVRSQAPPRFVPPPLEYSDLRSLAKDLGDSSRFAPFPGLERIIKSNVAPLVFPNDDGTSDLWVATLTRGDQFSDSTVRSSEFNIALAVYDHNRKLAGRDSVCLRGLKLLESSSDRKEMAIPGYVGCPHLNPGLYDFVVSLQGGDSANLGVYRDTITIPTRRSLRGASDVVVALNPGTVSGRGIERHGMRLHADPSGSLVHADSLSVYMEFPEAAIPGDYYRVTVSLVPKSNDLFSWQHRLDREVTLSSAIYPRTALQGVYRAEIPMSGAPTGKYFLTVQIASQLEDPKGESPVMSWTEIELKR